MKPKLAIKRYTGLTAKKGLAVYAAAARSQTQTISPTAKDLKFDYTFQVESICYNCANRSCCKIASLLNLPVMECRHFAES